MINDSTPWWRGGAIYQIYPRSFADTNGDGVGDLPGITAHLDYVARLGVDAVWISPFYTSPMRDFGYDIADYCAVDPIFGTLADFDALVAKAHQLGLKVLIDQVYAHTAQEHAWFRESRESRDNPKADWYVWVDPKADGSPPNNWQSVFGGPAWTWDARRQQYYLHNFLPSQPQLNCHNLDVQEALLEVMAFWLDRGVDGFRVDAVNFTMHDPALTDNPAKAAGEGGGRTRPFDYQWKLHNQGHADIPQFIKRIRALTDAYGAAFTVAEVGGDDAPREMKLFTSGDRHFMSAYSFAFLYADTLTPALVAEALQTWPDEPGIGWPSWALSNHDAPRWISRWLPNGADADAYARMVMLLFAAFRGTIILWQGEELGLEQVDIPFEQLQDPEAIANWPLTLSRDGTRTPMPWQSDAPHAGFTSGTPWLPLGPRHASRAVDVQEADTASLLHWTRQCLALRKAHKALRTGRLDILEVGEHFIAFTRSAGDETLLCAYNLSDQALAWRPDGAFELVSSVNGGAPDGSLPPFAGYIARTL